MAAPRTKSNDERLRHLAEVARLYLARKTQLEIAEATGVTRQQITYDLKVIRRTWRMSAIKDFDAKQDELLAHWENLERMYHDAWLRSCEAAKVELAKAKRSQSMGESIEKSTRTEDQVGDPRFLAGIERCLQERAKILGLYAPTKSELAGPGGQPIGMGFDEIVKILRGVNDTGPDQGDSTVR